MAAGGCGVNGRAAEVATAFCEAQHARCGTFEAAQAAIAPAADNRPQCFV